MLPLFITILNISIAWIISATPEKREIAAGFILIPLTPIILLVSVIIYSVVYYLPLNSIHKMAINLTTCFILTIPIIYSIIIDDGITELKKFNCGQNMCIVLTMDSFCDPTCSLYYQIFIDDREVVSRTYIYTSSNTNCSLENVYELSYKAVKTGDGKFIAIVAEKCPHVPFVLYDLDSGKSCSGQNNLKLKMRFEKEFPELRNDSHDQSKL